MFKYVISLFLSNAQENKVINCDWTHKTTLNMKFLLLSSGQSES